MNISKNFIENNIAKGRFKNASEVIRAGLLLLEEEQQKVAILRTALNEGINIGIAFSFNPRDHLKGLKAGIDRSG